MNRHFQYLGYMIRHKWAVYRAGRRLGVGRLRLLVHDWSKFLPSEWFGYLDKFYPPPPKQYGNWTPQCAVDAFRAMRQEAIDDAMSLSWNRHQKRQPHHWQYWCLIRDDAAIVPLPMPFHIIREMVADWAGAGYAITGKWEVRRWYEKQKAEGKIILHKRTRWYVETLLDRYFSLDGWKSRSTSGP